MMQIVVPVRYPLTEHSQATLSEAIDIANEREGSLTVLHVNLYQDSHETTRSQLKHAVEQTFEPLSNARYVVRKGLLVEETILEEIAAADADVVVIGKRQASHWRRMIRRLVDDPDIERYLEEELDCDVVTVAS